MNVKKIIAIFLIFTIYCLACDFILWPDDSLWQAFFAPAFWFQIPFLAMGESYLLNHLNATVEPTFNVSTSIGAGLLFTGIYYFISKYKGSNRLKKAV